MLLLINLMSFVSIQVKELSKIKKQSDSEIIYKNIKINNQRKE